MSRVRVRFAPSPTGYVHVGNARTALFNWLFARHSSGAFVLRIEDTDIERSETRFEAQLLEDLRWFGLDWDEGPDQGGAFGPYRQSERKELYARYATQLIDQGHAYYCFCSAEQLEAEREAALIAGGQPRYSGRCRSRPPEEAARKVAAGEPAAIRLKIADGVFAWNDLVHGAISFSSDVIDDLILIRSDGHPVYNFVVVIDDHLMEISQVIRGDDHISNTPRQLALYRAFGWQPPEFAHLSTILGPDRKPLSKRHGATSLQSFRELGILPEALRNYLLLLGWSAADGKSEKFTTEEMISQFSLERVHKSPAVFDPEKLNWLNWEYMASGHLASQGRLLVFRAGFEDFLTKRNYIRQGEIAKATGLINEMLGIYLDSKGRTSFQDIAEIAFEYDAQVAVRNGLTQHVAEDPVSREVLGAFVPKVLESGEITYNRFREIAKTVQRETGKKGKELFHPIRVALTGAVSGPEMEKLIPIFEEGAKLSLARPVKSTAQRLREFSAAAKIDYQG